MADVADRLAGQLALIAGLEVCEVPADETWIDAALVLCNVSSSARVVSVYIVPAGEAVAPEYAVLFDAPLDCPMTLELARGWTLLEGDKIFVFTDEDDGVSVYLSFARRDVA